MAKAQKKITTLTIEPRPVHQQAKVVAQTSAESHPIRKRVKTTAKVPAQNAKPAKSAPTPSAPLPKATVTGKVTDAAPVLRHSSKQATLITLMRRAEGATLDDLTSATGWQRHSVRGAISGAVKKRLGFVIVSSVEDRGRVYRIAGERR